LDVAPGSTSTTTARRGVSVRTIQLDQLRGVAVPRHACVDQPYTFTAKPPLSRPLHGPLPGRLVPGCGSSGAEPQPLRHGLSTWPEQSTLAPARPSTTCPPSTLAACVKGAATAIGQGPGRALLRRVDAGGGIHRKRQAECWSWAWCGCDPVNRAWVCV
jgi:hypothetical protein